MQGRWLPLWIGAALALTAVLVGLSWGVGDEEQWRLAARYTARVGLPVFLVTYVASSLVRLWPGGATRTLMRHRRQWGLAFALTHSVHLGALAMAHIVVGQWPSPVTIAGGGLAYVLLYVMAATSNTASQRTLGVWWKRLHSIGIHWLWFIFTFSYAGRIAEPGTRIEGALFAGLLVAALGLRIVARRAGPPSA